ncbi:hypothetical protein PR048_001768 [Dryococelus australis]|uniref:Uncharacterized protein n=1 Tax=Dryococelus australis TaxID=614101 RepID=A0ABQ9IJN2_9NEOP|nr:hypothetical protein PR048_001768 [Dryococelus australis]
MLVLQVGKDIIDGNLQSALVQFANVVKEGIGKYVHVSVVIVGFIPQNESRKTGKERREEKKIMAADPAAAILLRLDCSENRMQRAGVLAGKALLDPAQGKLFQAPWQDLG